MQVRYVYEIRQLQLIGLDEVIWEKWMFPERINNTLAQELPFSSVTVSEWVVIVMALTGGCQQALCGSCNYDCHCQYQVVNSWRVGNNAGADWPVNHDPAFFSLSLKEVCSARLTDNDIHPISPKTPAPQYQPIDRKKRNGKIVEDYVSIGKIVLANKKALSRFLNPPVLHLRIQGQHDRSRRTLREE